MPSVRPTTVTSAGSPTVKRCAANGDSVAGSSRATSGRSTQSAMHGSAAASNLSRNPKPMVTPTTSAAANDIFVDGGRRYSGPRVTEHRRYLISIERPILKSCQIAAAFFHAKAKPKLALSFRRRPNPNLAITLWKNHGRVARCQ